MKSCSRTGRRTNSMADTRRDALRVAVLARAVYPLHGFGGLERHVFDLVHHHLERGLHVRLVTRPPVPGRGEAAEWTAWQAIASHPNFAIETVPYRTFPLAGRRGTTIADRSTAYPLFGRRAGRVTLQHVAAGTIDIVYAVGASGYGYALARRRGEGAASAPFVFNPQGLEEFGGADGSYGGQPLKGVAYAGLRRAVRRCAAAADVVLATDRALVPIVGRQLSVDPARLRLVPNGIDLRAVDALAGPTDGRAMRRHAGVADHDMVFLSVGRLERNKGFQHMARALARWCDRPSWTWVIAGDGPYRRAIEQAAADAGILPRIRWLGRIPDRDLHAWYEAADLFVHPSVYEGSSLVTLEAMGHRRPVVATRAGGLPDKVLPGVTGWLVEPGDAAGLAEALDAAVARRSDWVSMGSSGRRLVETTFDWPVVQAALEAIYTEMLPGSQGTAQHRDRRERMNAESTEGAESK
jgi:glycogen synthase